MPPDMYVPGMWVNIYVAVLVVCASFNAERGRGNSSGDGEGIVAATRNFA